MITKLCTNGLHMYCQDPSCTCTTCHLTCLNGHPARVLYDGLCADCERARVRSLPTPVTLCDNDPTHGRAFRNPKTRRNEFFCMNCHVAAGEDLPLTAADLAGVLAPNCAGADILDERHSPYNLHGSVWVCSRCGHRLASRAREVPDAWRHPRTIRT